jgi:Transposase
MTKSARTTKQSKKGQTAAAKRWTVGIDLGDQWSRYCVLDEEGESAEEGRFRSTPEALRKHFAGSEPMRIAIEAGTHSLWVSEQLRQVGHEVPVANAREIRAITHSDYKSDQLDAEKTGSVCAGRSQDLASDYASQYGDATFTECDPCP